MNSPERVQTTNTNNLELHKGDNFIFGIDVSGSMATVDCPGNMERIEYLKEKVKQFAVEASKYDEDGIDIITFGHNINVKHGITAENASTIIDALHATEMSTRTADLIAKAYDLHKIGGYERTVLFIATDGEPSDRDAVKKVIIDITHAITDPGEFDISFLTVGVINPALRSFLTSLDDDLTGAKYDIVDVKALEEVDFMSAFVGAVTD